MLLLFTDPAGVNHLTGAGHPESPERLDAVLGAAGSAGLGELVDVRTPEPATRIDLERAHDVALLDHLDELSGLSGALDADTVLSAASVEVARRAAGAGLAAVAALDRGEGTAAFCAVRPPGHHATRQRSMGFCLLNNLAVTAMALVDRGERVLIADFDAHHGNGTQDIVFNEANVLFVSWHQSPLYPGTGAVTETGGPDAVGHTVNLPLAAGSTGDLYLASLDDVIGPLVESFAPTWLLISAGFDAHRDDPITDLGLSSGDFHRITAELIRFVPPGRTVAFLEGGYGLQGLADSAAATMSALVGVAPGGLDPLTSGSGSRAPIDALRRVRDGLQR